MLTDLQIVTDRRPLPDGPIGPADLFDATVRRRRRADAADASGDALGERGSTRPTRVALHGVTAELLASAGPVRDLLSIPFGGYLAGDLDGDTDFRIALRPVRTDNDPPAWWVSAGIVDLEVAKPEEAALQAEYGFATEATRRLRRRHMHIHAAVASIGDHGVLLVGRSGAGKSTTSVALAQAGATLYSDDVALIDPDSRRPLSFPRPIKLDERSRALLGELGLRVRDEDRLGESVARLALPGLAPTTEPGPPVRTVIFFTAGRRERPALAPLTAAEALMRFVREAGTEQMDPRGASAGALGLVNGARCYELAAGDLAATVETILSVADRG